MSRTFDTSPTEPILAGIKWSEHYSCYRARIAGWLDLAFSYGVVSRGMPSTGFHVSISGLTLKARGSDPEDAARIAVVGARDLLAKALKELEDKTA